MYALMKMMRV